MEKNCDFLTQVPTEFVHVFSNSNHRLKSVVNMPICVLKRGDENEARFWHQNKVNLRNRKTKWPPTPICSPCIFTGSPTQTQNKTCGLPFSTLIMTVECMKTTCNFVPLESP